MQLEVGKTYIDGWDNKAHIESVESDGLFRDSDGCRFHSDGRFFGHPEGSLLNLIKEST